jgi:hypothetical protein
MSRTSNVNVRTKSEGDFSSAIKFCFRKHFGVDVRAGKYLPRKAGHRKLPLINRSSGGPRAMQRHARFTKWAPGGGTPAPR